MIDGQAFIIAGLVTPCTRIADGVAGRGSLRREATGATGPAPGGGRSLSNHPTGVCDHADKHGDKPRSGNAVCLTPVTGV